MTMMCVTHELGFAKTVDDRIIFVKKFKIIEKNYLQVFFDHPYYDRTMRLPSHIL